MAIPAYTGTIYVNDTSPPLNATNMNKTETAIEDVTDEAILLRSDMDDVPTLYEAIDATIAREATVNVFTVAQKKTILDVIYATNVAFDMDTSNHFKIDLTGNITLDNPTNITTGEIQDGIIKLTQDATGGRTLSLGTSWVLVGTDSTDTTADKINVYKYTVIDTTIVLYEFVKAI